jgi:hypothetical protein
VTVYKAKYIHRRSPAHQLRYNNAAKSAVYIRIYHSSNTRTFRTRSSTMDRLFSPCTRLHDLLHDMIDPYQNDFTEDQCHITINALNYMEELNLNVSTEEFLSAERAFTYADLYAMLGNEDTVAWLTPHTAVARDGNSDRLMDAWDSAYRFCFSVDGKDVSALALSSEHLLEICDFVLRLLAVSVVHSVRLNNWSIPELCINVPTLAYLMEQCQSLKVLSLEGLYLDEDHCRVLGTYSRPGLEIVLDSCTITSAGASALAEVLGRNQGPTKLDDCDIDCLVLADGLRRNSHLKSLRPRFSSNHEVEKRQILAIAGAVRENKGLVVFDLSSQFCVDDETWGAICDSLETHPTLEVLDLRVRANVMPAPALLKCRIQAILDMMKMNLSLHTIHLPDHYSEHELFRGSVVPYLETNRFRPRLLAIQRTRPIPYRAKVLGRALLSARTDANSFWMLLSGNAEVAFPSRTTVAAANLHTPMSLPTPATAAATSTSTTDAAAFAGPVTAAATAGHPTAAAAAARSGTTPSTASDIFPFAPTIPAAANVATPSSGQKRKAQISMLPDPEA